ncbi:hypothetical protein BMW22_19415 [Rhizobium leguminosarum]|uniref:Transposase n=1 Tax=Rhizobium leguminosarum TaxID=384 RepID=A0A1L3ZCY9_RHILE|nr:hypothetical protein BMW22_19415 [Rhizobium leguminosarum]
MHIQQSFMVGIDVSKAHLDVAVEGKRAVVRFDNDAPGRAALATAVAGAELVVVEATGGYEMAIGAVGRQYRAELIYVAKSVRLFLHQLMVISIS